MGAPGEKIRLALALANYLYTDNRSRAFSEWAALKPTLKYTTVSVLDVNGQRLHRSGAILHWVGQLGSGSLYPVQDRELCCKIEEVMGVGDDLHRAWTPAMMLGMGLHALYGFPAVWPEQSSTVKRLRLHFVQENLPVFMEYFADELKESGGDGFLCGRWPTTLQTASSTAKSFTLRAVLQSMFRLTASCLGRRSWPGCGALRLSLRLQII